MSRSLLPGLSATICADLDIGLLELTLADVEAEKRQPVLDRLGIDGDRLHQRLLGRGRLPLLGEHARQPQVGAGLAAVDLDHLLEAAGGLEEVLVVAVKGGQQQQRFDVVRLARQDVVHPLARVGVLLAEQQEGRQLELGFGVRGLDLGHGRIRPEGVLGVPQLQARLAEHQVRLGEPRVDLDGVLELDLGALVFALVEVLLALGEVGLLLLLVRRAGAEGDGRHQEREKNHMGAFH